jgi:pyruvate,water dikinase
VYERYTHKEPPKYIRGWEAFDDDQLPDDGRGLRGMAASSGVIAGRACVCRSLDEIGKVKKGDILITVATDPAWTTVFSIIGGVVVETGGVVSHAVMISREYGIPCVANLAQACDLIPDGRMISVDGSSGRVVIHDEE